MKILLLALIALLLVPAAAFPETKSKAESNYCATTTAFGFWPPDSTVNVYFVRGLFTSVQKQILSNTLETWTQRTEATSTIRFSYPEETAGLIDCLGCLTVTRQEVFTNKPRRQGSFNRLRGDQRGQLISAWIGFDSALADSQKLRSVLLQTLDAATLLRDETGKECRLL